MRRILVSLLAAAALTGCGGATPYYAGERFGADTMHRRAFAASPERACEAARLALLADGYVVTRAPAAGSVTLVGAKAFREKEARRALLQLHVTCASAAQGSVLYVTAVERHFEVKQTKESTSVGIPLVSPLSVTTSSESEGQIETSGETVESRRFYERFYAAVARELGAR